MKDIKLIIAGQQDGSLDELAAALVARGGLTVSRIDSFERICAAIDQGLGDVLIADEQVQGCSGLELIRQVVRYNPFINTALVSPLYPDEFHHEAEGLGVFMQLPVKPGADTAEKILAHLARIS